MRHAIWLAASSAVFHDPALKLYFQKKRDEGKPYMASVGHACRKMVSIIYAVMRDNKAYVRVSQAKSLLDKYIAGLC